MSNSNNEITPDTTFRATLGGWSKIIVPFFVIALAIFSYAISWEKRFSDLMTAITSLASQTNTYQEGDIRGEGSQQNDIDNNTLRIDNLYQQDP